MSDLLRFRDIGPEAVPPWLRGYWGGRWLYCVWLLLDDLVDAAVAAVKMRHPGLYSYQSLGLIGQNRGIRRGFAEADASYAARLMTWRADQRRKGNTSARYSQLRGYFAGYTVPMRTVWGGATENQVKDHWTDGEGHETFTWRPWNWDGISNRPSRFWLVLFPPNELWQREPDWGTDDGVWGEDGVWGSTATPDEVATVLDLVHEWRAPHSHCAGIILVFEIDRNDWYSWAINPDGLWDRPGTRPWDLNYWTGV